jgi:N-acetyl-anhydromuramyl-L-alanine amidase AmpD
MKLVESYLTNNPCYKNNVNKVDSRYTNFQKNGPSGLMLHSVGCSQPSASVFVKNWNKSDYDKACVHGFIDANDGTIYQTLPWNFRGWHGGGSSNNTHVGVEMCEPSTIKYTGGSSFTVTDKAKAQACAVRTYEAAVELFAMLCVKYNLDPQNAIVSHSEGYKKGIATNHGDPEHLWSGLGLSYTMDTFRAAVAAKIEKDKNGEKTTTEEVDEVRYNKLDEMPTYAKSTIEKLIKLGYLAGSGTVKDSNGYPADLDLSIDMIRIFVINDRAGLYN